MFRNMVFLSSLSILLAAGISFAEKTEDKPRVKVAVSSKKDPSGSYLVNFAVKPQSGMQLTLEAPWKLSLVETSDLSYHGAAKQKEKDSKNHHIYTKAQMDEKVPGYQVKMNRLGKDSKPTQISFTLEAFSCTQDKTRCFKDVLKETYTLKD